MKTASFHEIFSSRQGEGTYVGEYMSFVRFGHCALRCQWCDTPEGLDHKTQYRIESPARSAKFEFFPNPISIEQLNGHLAGFADEFLAVTGGEPLEQADFLVEWFPTVTNKKILLETSGILTKQLEKVLPHVFVVSMDFKLPSSTGMKAYWKEHEQFLATALAGKNETYVKIVVTESTTDEDVKISRDLIAAQKTDLPTIVQPVSITKNFHEKISDATVARFSGLLQEKLSDVRVIKQMHKVWNVL